MNEMLKKKIPTILGIFLLLVGITTGVYLVELGPQNFAPRASLDVVPEEVRISNLAESSFTVSWKTKINAIGFVKYGTSASKLNLSALDDRDQNSGAGDDRERKYSLHYVTISSLKPNTTYYFNIVSGVEAEAFGNNGQPYSVKTTSSLSSSTFVDTSYGVIYNKDLTPTVGAVVYVGVENGSLLSSLTGNSGTWAVPLSASLLPDSSAFLDYDPELSVVNIEVAGEGGASAKAKTLTSNDSPVSDIVLGKIHDFTQDLRKTEEQETKGSQFILEELTEAGFLTTDIQVSLENVDEGEAINTQLPEFMGGGPPGTRLEIVVESSQPMEGEVVVNKSGSWSWSPPYDLEPGEHKITVRWIDQQGLSQFFTRSFVIYAQGESELPAFEATPSAATATPVPSIEPTPTISLPIPTTTPTRTPTLTASQAAQATEPAVPTPGGGNYSLFMIFLGLTLTASGGYIFLSKKTS